MQKIPLIILSLVPLIFPYAIFMISVMFGGVLKSFFDISMSILQLTLIFSILSISIILFGNYIFTNPATYKFILYFCLGITYITSVSAIPYVFVKSIAQENKSTNETVALVESLLEEKRKPTSDELKKIFSNKEPSDNLYKGIEKLIEFKILDPNAHIDGHNGPYSILYAAIDPGSTGVGEFRLIELLLKNGANPNNENLLTILARHVGSDEEKFEIFKLLIQYGTDVNVTNLVGKSVTDLLQENRGLYADVPENQDRFRRIDTLIDLIEGLQK